MVIFALLNVLKLLAIAIGAGTATVILAQSIAAFADKKISKDEQRLLMVNMIVLRVAVLLLFISHAGFFTLSHTLFGSSFDGYEAFQNVQSLTWLLTAVLFGTFIFLDQGVISRKIGSVIQLSTWYALVFVWAWPAADPIQIDSFVFAYVLFTLICLMIVKNNDLYTFNTQISAKK